jgi:hypothetical protein
MRRFAHAKLPMLLVFLGPTLPLGLAAGGCAGQAPPPTQARAQPVSRPEPTPSAAAEEPAAPAETLAKADLAYDSQLGASRGQFDVERQVAVLREAVLLYSQFLERAVGRPELEPAVRKSHERIADANATIEFLLASLRAEGQPPAAKTE